MEQQKKTLEELFRGRDETISEKDFRDNLATQVGAMSDQAFDHRLVPVLVEVLTSQLATVAFRCGPFATGDILAKLGSSLSTIAACEQAKQEAEQARSEGRKPH